MSRALASPYLHGPELHSAALANSLRERTHVAKYRGSSHAGVTNAGLNCVRVRRTVQTRNMPSERNLWCHLALHSCGGERRRAENCKRVPHCLAAGAYHSYAVNFSASCWRVPTSANVHCHVSSALGLSTVELLLVLLLRRVVAAAQHSSRRHSLLGSWHSLLSFGGACSLSSTQNCSHWCL